MSDGPSSPGGPQGPPPHGAQPPDGREGAPPIEGPSEPSLAPPKELDVEIVEPTAGELLEAGPGGGRVEIKTVELGMWTEPGWDSVRGTAERVRREEAGEPMSKVGDVLRYDGTGRHSGKHFQVEEPTARCALETSHVLGRPTQGDGGLVWLPMEVCKLVIPPVGMRQVQPGVYAEEDMERNVFFRPPEAALEHARGQGRLLQAEEDAPLLKRGVEALGQVSRLETEVERLRRELYEERLNRRTVEGLNATQSVQLASAARMSTDMRLALEELRLDPVPDDPEVQVVLRPVAAALARTIHGLVKEHREWCGKVELP